jgi:hypothetical protein
VACEDGGEMAVFQQPPKPGLGVEMSSATDKVSRGRHLLVLLLVMVVAAVVYGRVTGHLFLAEWDDPESVVDNMLAHGLSGEHVTGGRA